MALSRAGARSRRSKPPFSRQQAQLIENLREAIVVLDGDGRILFANSIVDTLLGHRPADLAGVRLSDLLADGSRVDPRIVGTVLVNMRHRDGTYIPIEISCGRPVSETRGRLLVPAMLRDGTARAEAEAARAEVVVARRHTSLLSQASGILVATRGPSALQLLARLVVSSYAGTCVVDVMSEDGRERMASAHAAGAPSEPPAAVDQAIVETLRTGTSREVHLPSAQGGQSAVVAPLSCEGRTVGALACITTPGQPAFTAADRAFAEELGRQAALALYQARILSRALFRIGHGLVVLAKRHPGDAQVRRPPSFLGSC
jgi:PAS domain S-box-containing protein